MLLCLYSPVPFFVDMLCLCARIYSLFVCPSVSRYLNYVSTFLHDSDNAIFVYVPPYFFQIPLKDFSLNNSVA